MPTLSVQSFPEALKRFMARTPVASSMSSAEWNEVDVDIRQHSFWSARQPNLQAVEKMKELIAEAMRVEDSPDKATMDRARFVADMRAYHSGKLVWPRCHGQLSRDSAGLSMPRAGAHCCPPRAARLAQCMGRGRWQALCWPHDCSQG